MSKNKKPAAEKDSEKIYHITLKVFMRRGDDFLVLKDSDNGYGDLPGGRIEHFEFYKPWPEAIAREVYEELGPALKYRLKPEPLFVFPHYIRKAKSPALGIAFEAEYLGGEVRLSDEHVDFRWVACSSYDPQQDFKEYLLHAVERYLKR